MTHRSLTIGGVEVSSPIWLAPLAGVSTYTFRSFHRSVGAGLTHTEMVSAVGLSYSNKKTSRLLGEETEPGPMALQLFAPDSDSIAAGAALALSGRRFDALEINMACPMPKVTKKGSGSRLLETPDTARRMVAALKEFGLPVWVKLRITDPKKHELSTEEFCDLLLSAGADLLMLHGRTPAQRYEGRADKEAVCRAARKFKGLIVASGDYFAPADALTYLDGGCAGVLAARGALRNVFLIPETLALLGYDVPERFLNPTAADQIDTLIQIGRSGTAHEGESFALVLVKRMLSGLFKGFYGAAAIRQSCAACREWEKMEQVLLEIKKQLTVQELV